MTHEQFSDKRVSNPQEPKRRSLIAEQRKDHVVFILGVWSSSPAVDRFFFPDDFYGNDEKLNIVSEEFANPNVWITSEKDGILEIKYVGESEVVKRFFSTADLTWKVKIAELPLRDFFTEIGILSPSKLQVN